MNNTTKMMNPRSRSYHYTNNLLLGAVLAFVALSTVGAFAPSRLPQVHRTATNVGRRDGMALFDATTTESSTTTTIDAFDDYQQNDKQRTVAFRDDLIGTGDLVEEGKLVTMAFKGRLLATGKVFDENPSGYAFRYENGKVIPGWETGIAGMKVGGKRTLRVPPHLAYGDKWFKGTIPPNSHLEFDLELMNVAQTPQEEIWEQMQAFGIGRGLGIAACAVVFVVAPMLG